MSPLRLIVLAAAALLAACASRPSVKIDGAPVAILASPVAQPDAKLLAPCADPVDLRGYQGLNAGPVERLWMVDRGALIDCRDRKEALQRFYRNRDAALAGN